VQEPGFKYNLSDIQAAIGVHQLRRLESFITERARLVSIYRQQLADVPEVEVPEEPTCGRHAWHLLVIRLKLDALSISRDQFIRELKNRGIGTSVHFIPIPLHPFYRRWANQPAQQCPKALELYTRIVSLPLYPGLRTVEVTRVTEAVKDVVVRHRLGHVAACRAAAH
jgi:dTDP-4-amino-4,6-dideoxygalactose transaminase